MYINQTQTTKYRIEIKILHSNNWAKLKIKNIGTLGKANAKIKCLRATNKFEYRLIRIVTRVYEDIVG